MIRAKHSIVVQTYYTTTSILNLSPSGKSIFVEYHQLIVEKSQLHVEDSLKRAREEQDSFVEQFLNLK